MAKSFDSSFKVQDNSVMLNWSGESVSTNFALPVSAKEKELFKSLTMGKHFPQNDSSYANLVNVLIDKETNVRAILTKNNSGLNIGGNMEFVQPGSAVYFSGLSSEGELNWKDDTRATIKALNPRAVDDIDETVENWVELNMEGLEPEMTKVPESETGRVFEEVGYDVHNRKAIPYLDFGGDVRLYINPSDEGILRQRYLEAMCKAAEEGEFGYTKTVSPSEIKAEYDPDIENINDLEVMDPSAILVNMLDNPDLVLGESEQKAQFYLQGSDYSIEVPRSVALTYTVSEGEEIGLTQEMAESMTQRYGGGLSPENDRSFG